MPKRAPSRPNIILAVDRIAAVLVALLGGLHLAVGAHAFAAPTQRGVWFLSAGFLLITTGLGNLACSKGASPLQSLAAASGSLAILILGGLLGAADRHLLLAPRPLCYSRSARCSPHFGSETCFAREPTC
jgi:hypothetical protein